MGAAADAADVPERPGSGHPGRGEGRPPMRTLDDLELEGRRVLVRVDLNVPLEKGSVADDTRLREILPTLERLRGEGARIVLCSHLGRPEGKPRDELRLDPVARRLSELVGREIRKLDDCVGAEVSDAIGEMEAGDVILLENTRFHRGEEDNDPDFARRLADLAELYVNDAFGAAHRAHASTEGVAHHLPAAAGLLMVREVETLEAVREDPEPPFVAILGGAKVSDKIGVIQRLLERVDSLLIGGAMASTFLKAAGERVGSSRVEDDHLEEARTLLEATGERLVLPVDVVVAEEMDADARRETVAVGEVPEEWQILDVGPETIQAFQKELQGARSVLWNGPVGAFELDPFAGGTESLAKALAESDATTVVGGGETASAVGWAGVKDRLTHVSTGGGAFLEFMEGKELPGVAVLRVEGDRD